MAVRDAVERNVGMDFPMCGGDDDRYRAGKSVNRA
jgi:hypothetical protein